MGHTPGKWSFDEGAGEVLSDVDEHGFVVATIESNDADGPLIAAAPEMLEMLKFLRKFLAYTEAWKVVKLIEKIEGKS